MRQTGRTVIEPQPYTFATSADAARAWLTEATGVTMVAVDTETSGWDPHRDDLLLVQVSAGRERPVLVLDARRVDPRILQPLLGDPAVLKIFHHGAFDLRFLAVAGVMVRRCADTMLAQQLLDGGDPTAPSANLARLASFRLGMELDKSVRTTFESGGPFTEQQLRYAADDVVATLGVFDQQWRELVAGGLVRVARLEFEALTVLADLAVRGVHLDVPRWARVLEGLEAELPALEERVQAELVSPATPRTLFGPEPVNLDSPEQVLAALARLGLELPSTREVVLRDQRGHAAVDALLAYRQVAKITSNWGGEWSGRVVHPATGRIHADWRQIVGTGRIACNEPNLTQVPRDARYRCCFGGQPGRALVVADYSQQELRILAAVSGDERLTEVFTRKGDLHRSTAAMAFGVGEDAVTREQRAAAKALNFGLMYGMGAPGFARTTGMTVEQAADVIRRYFAAFPKVSAWLTETETLGRRTGRVRTPLGRLRVLGEGARTTLARNAPIQGAGADMTKRALVEVEGRLAERFGREHGRSFGGRAATLRPDGLVLVVHDELVVDVEARHAQEVAQLVREGMLAAATEQLGAVPAAVDVRIRDRWNDIPEPQSAQQAD